MTPDPDNHTPSLAQASRALRAGALSSVELTRHCLGRIAALDPGLNAFVTLTAEHALAAAHKADEELRGGRRRGPLHGIPLGLKDIIDMAGVPTTGQSCQLLDHVPTRNATAVERLEQAGAVLMGKLTTHEFAFGTPRWGPPGPPARNPWHAAHFAGGSSSGAAVAVASGMLLGALGSDSAGSVRSPAALCGVAGFKPTRARIDLHGSLPLAPSLDCLGPLARNVEDCALLYRALARPDEAFWSADDPPWGEIKGLKIGVVRSFLDERSGTSAPTRAAIEDAISTFEALGCQVRDVSLPAPWEWNAAGMVILLSEAYAYHEHWLRSRPQQYGVQLREALLLGATLSAADYCRAQEHRRALSGNLDTLLENVDLLLCPIQAGEAPTLEQLAPWGFLQKPSYGIAFNLSDNPALSVCCGFGPQGLPLALQLVGRRNDEITPLRAGHAYEQACEWHRRRPPL
ncbi:amidase [Stutzerimonas kirkiae]|uniref:Asp-tRNA(Asn)/Glu-tRNA(Gln) amidotransferase GatCAB subunit A n=1 Tax=Stutzerimonas kirkiae TaxID=2211392 RepID=A0A4Q9QXT2_9GAMM|nr:amidase [Stutzerimonas kirkiae]TBU87748.1 Asp-tRNA(Asn)/Glu-tRNA(Gln) amidotransferase GatCAB subunit A [Stutzerimonas kirkiae]TBU98028.1 Asp-tRNA(Asn)/Glu-tRNA(Gln) amidotransferase GatCAB subunit A [Stutzerimonas kirkiae]TBV12299.1 Asp-tRNA(Asn)/Glu-tRNA(Gln) amidotransferase GatCAB subunit A [Stutzerimonas kirkiae]